MNKRLALVVLLAVASSSAAAAWTIVGVGTTNTVYADSSTIRRDGDMAKMWYLVDHKTATEVGTGKPYMSMRVQSEYDCKEEQARALFASFFAGHMAEGEVVLSRPGPGPWEPVPPGSTRTGLLWKFACAKP